MLKNIYGELIRKAIHISFILLALIYKVDYKLGISLSLLFLILYLFLEKFRREERALPLLNKIYKYSLKKHERNQKIILSPLLLNFGISLTMLLFPYPSNIIASITVCFGDGLASIFGKLFKIKLFGEKTLSGFLTVLLVTSLSYYYFNPDVIKSLIVGFTAASIEILPLKEWDNIVLPLSTALFSFAISM